MSETLGRVPVPRNGNLEIRKSGRDKNTDQRALFFKNAQISHAGLGIYKFAPDKRSLQKNAQPWLSGISEIIRDDAENWRAAKCAITEITHTLVCIENTHKVEQCLTLQTPLAIGLGIPAPNEMGITLDHLLGVPYIPGSALKGVALRAAVARELNLDYYLGKEFKDKMKEALENNICRIREVFGTQDQAGKVIFFDAYPVGPGREGKLLEPDLVNPHAQKYYSGTSGFTDYENPNPSFFLRVPEKTEFKFVLASEDPELVERAWRWLECGLREIGVGAKTSSGYGRFG